MRIIYIDVDCLRPDHLGCYGYNRPTSPCIDSIAQDGMRFTNHYCSSSPCMPSRAAWSSGRFGVRNGVVSNHGLGGEFHIERGAYGGPKPANEMFPRQLRKHDYNAYSFTTFADRHSAQWFMTGWTEFHTPNLKCGGDDASEVNAKVLPWLKNNAAQEDYFMHVHYWNAHRCYFIDAAWSERFKDYPVTQTWPTEEVIQEHQKLHGPFVATNQPYGPGKLNKSPFPLMPDYVSNRADFDKMVTGYDACIAYVDHHIQQIVDELKAQGLYEDTAIIISADHGDAFGEHGIYTDHCFADECIHNIPFIVRWPGVTPPNSSCDAFMYNIDMAPTICDLIGAEIPSGWDGQSFAANMRGQTTSNAYADRDYLVWDTGLYAAQRCVRSKTHLYQRTYHPGAYAHIPEIALYDMRSDPNQTQNIANECPDLVKQYQQIMDDWVLQQQNKPFACNEDPLMRAAEQHALINK